MRCASTIGRTLTDTNHRRPPGQPAQLERGSFPDGSMHGGSQPTDISLIHRRSSRLVPHHPRPLATELNSVLTRATISVSRPAPGRPLVLHSRLRHIPYHSKGLRPHRTNTRRNGAFATAPDRL